VIFSSGKNGYGAKTIQGQNNVAPPAANIDETTNATANRIFVIRPYTERTTAFNGPYDDLVVYMTPQDLLQPLIAEQTIAVCKAYCPACTGPGTPSPYCTGPNTPATAATASACKALRNPYPTCTGLGTPALCTVTTTPVPIGNPTPSCS
jgi:hypothetical protein